MKRYFLHFLVFLFQFCVIFNSCFCLLFSFFGFHLDLDMDARGEGMFCLPKYGLKFKIFYGNVFMFRENRILHCIIKNAIGVQYGIYNVFSKIFYFKTFDFLILSVTCEPLCFCGAWNNVLCLIMFNIDQVSCVVQNQWIEMII